MEIVIIDLTADQYLRRAGGDLQRHDQPQQGGKAALAAGRNTDQMPGFGLQFIDQIIMLQPDQQADVPAAFAQQVGGQGGTR